MHSPYPINVTFNCDKDLLLLKAQQESTDSKKLELGFKGGIKLLP